MIAENHVSRPTFKEILQYACDKKDAEILGGNVAGFYTSDFFKVFSMYENRNPRVKNPCIHSSLSLAEGEHLTDEQWQNVAEGYLKAIGIDTEKCPFIVVKHNDNGYEHVHLIASRVDARGRGHYLRSGEKYRDENGKLKEKGVNLGRVGMQFCRGIEKEYKLKEPKAVERTKSSRPEKERAKRRAVKKRGMTKEQAERVETAKEHIQKAIEKVILKTEFDLRTAEGREIFAQNLEKFGVKTRYQKAGISFNYDEISYSGTKLGTAYKYKNLLRRGLHVEEKRAKRRKKIKEHYQNARFYESIYWNLVKAQRGQKTTLAAELMKIYFALCALEERRKAFEESMQRRQSEMAFKVELMKKLMLKKLENESKIQTAEGEKPQKIEQKPVENLQKSTENNENLAGTAQQPQRANLAGTAQQREETDKSAETPKVKLDSQSINEKLREMLDRQAKNAHNQRTFRMKENENAQKETTSRKLRK